MRVNSFFFAARALLKKPKLLLLDGKATLNEPSDQRTTDHIVFQRQRALSIGKTSCYWLNMHLSHHDENERSESEKIVQEALDNIMSSDQVTCIVIAHRLSTIRNADRIAVRSGDYCGQSPLLTTSC